MSKKRYYTPSELVNKYPQIVEKLHWTRNDIGQLLRMQVLNGYTTKRKTMIEEESFLKVVKLANYIAEERIVKI